ncbi:deoxyguanosinetriphosphate triphosphohydrolase, putative [Rivularia sp. PCC 7116]|uniref:dGTP triphosphohydrolase n=1 Tax=Rivularia sp. PCC 7116 TaxID=373994 RepID=UPI00029EF04C|nr:dNTP triphosphohydrolase [Rivularia sp. PCC 7116]AFY57513.1 deoxyguanosinetriphosphate triphosphohydrolase, putative [Rivularia sp. PCC 7116]
MMQWQQLLTRQRLGKTSPIDSESARTCFQRDYDRLVFSSPFRRLKDKTQVYSLSENDYLRTRLIHSIEVSCVGRSLGTIVGNEIIKRHNLKDYTPSDFGDIVSAASLAHDIGNPPFGHAGEDAIQGGFKNWYAATQITLNKIEETDFNLFEGNAQGFRIISNLEMQPRIGGMQLTCPTLAAFAKYPRESYIPENILNSYQGKSIAKYNFFQAEKELFAEVAQTVGLIRRSNKAAWWARHPLAFLMEAADDICYLIVDVEDGFRMRYISFASAKQLLNAIAQRSESDIKEQANTEEEEIKYLRARAISKLVKEVADIFLLKESEMLTGEFDIELLALSKYASVLDDTRAETQNRVIKHPDIVSTRIAGHQILDYLFNEFANAVLSKGDKAEFLQQIIPQQYLFSDRQDSYYKILQVTDFISGMTDSYATNLFKKLKGISL